MKKLEIKKRNLNGTKTLRQAMKLESGNIVFPAGVVL